MRVDICDRLGHTGKERASGLCEGSFIFQQHCMKLLPLLIQSSGQIILQARSQKDGPQTQHFCQTVVKDSKTCPHFPTPPSNLIHSPSHRYTQLKVIIYSNLFSIFCPEAQELKTEEDFSMCSLFGLGRIYKQWHAYLTLANQEAAFSRYQECSRSQPWQSFLHAVTFPHAGIGTSVN